MIMAWSIERVREALGVPGDGEVTGLKLSLDGRFVEARVEERQKERALAFVDDAMVD